MPESKIISVDFDGTLNDGVYPAIGQPIYEIVDQLRFARACGQAEKGDSIK